MSSLLFAIHFNGEGGGNEVDLPAAESALHKGSAVWLHFDVNHADTRPWLEKHLMLDKYILDALLAEETRPRLIQLNQNSLLLILRGMNFNDEQAPEDMVSMRLWTDGQRVISMRKRQLKAVLDVRGAIATGVGPKNCSELICQLINRLFSRMEPVMRGLDETTDTIEEQVTESINVALRSEIINIRKQAIIFRRYIAPQRDAIGQLRMADIPWLDLEQKNQLQESYNHVTRYIEDLDAVRERAQVIKDEIANSLADKLNRNMYILSVIAAIFLPLGFLTGLLGVNVGGIPGAENHTAFYWFCGILTIIVILQVLWFKRRRWF